MTLKGTIENGRLVLDDGEGLPDGTRVDIRVRPAPRTRRAPKAADPLATLASRAVHTGVHDLAAEHDHYAYGTPKRKARRKAARPSKPAKGRRA